MTRLLYRWIVWMLPLGLIGCASDPRETRIRAVINTIDAAATDISTIQDSVAKAIKQAENKKLNAAEIKTALATVDSLKNHAKELQKEKQRIDGMSSSTKEQKDALAEQFRSKLSGAISGLDEKRRALEQTILEAEALDAESVKELRARLTEAEGTFASVARAR